MKSENQLDEIKSRIDIVEFISEYVPLKKSGQNYKGLCPFHPEKTPSFMVSRTKQIFHCFGCGTGGDAITFLMKHENLSFAEAVRLVAKKVGIDLKDLGFEKNSSSKRENLLRINEEAMKFFIQNLHKSDTARKYIEQRGLTKESVALFCIGYAHEERAGLYAHLRRAGYEDALIEDAGLAVRDGGGRRDLFRKRIIFPLFNLQNNVIAFGGRVMDNSLPKYINSPETEIFKKSENLFALNLSKDEIRKTGYALIVEGYLDSIICHQHNFKNVVAPLGTALTARHLHRLKLFTQKVVLVFDADEAGVAAAKRSLSILADSDFRTKVLLLPKGEDPDSFLRKRGGDCFKKMIDEALSVVEFALTTSRRDKVGSVREALEIIDCTKDLLIADEMLVELAERSKVSEVALRAEFEKMKGKHSKKRAEITLAGKITHNEERILLSTLISFPEKADSVLSRLKTEDLKDETVRSIFEKIKLCKSNCWVGSVIDKADEKERVLLSELSIDPGFDPEHVDENINDCLSVVSRRKLAEKRRIAEDTADITLLDSLLKEKRRFIKRGSV
ncbi:MAG: DNA primase [Nitrospirota bacterium]